MPAAPHVLAVRMGLGHLRAALPLAEALGVPLERADLAPFSSPLEVAAWSAVREAYEALSRRAATHADARGWLDRITAIPDHGDYVLADAATRAHGALVAAGFGGRLVARLRETGRPLLTTFYTPALVAVAAGLDAACVVTDADCARAWAPARAEISALRWFAPTDGVVRRLRQYGVAGVRVERTGFPLPPALVATAEQDLGARLARLGGPGPLRLLVAVGGAGAQVEAVQLAIAAAGPALASGRVILRVLTGLRPEVARHVSAFARTLSVDVRVEAADTFEAHAAAFAAAVREADAVWTKPSEVSFYAALGVPLLLAAPVGVQEARNVAWLEEHGVRLDASADLVAQAEALRADGTLARVAEASFARLERGGTAAIARAYGVDPRGVAPPPPAR